MSQIKTACQNRVTWYWHLNFLSFLSWVHSSQSHTTSKVHITWWAHIRPEHRRNWSHSSFSLIFSVNKLKHETDVMINIPDVEHGNAVIRIEGNKEGVKKAKEVSGRGRKMSGKCWNYDYDDRSICYMRIMIPKLNHQLPLKFFKVIGLCVI